MRTCPGTPGQGEWNDYVNTYFQGALSNDPVGGFTNDTREHYYNTTRHSWRHLVEFGGGLFQWREVGFQVLFGETAFWLGEQPDRQTATDLIENFSASNSYSYRNVGERTVEVLDTSTYVAPVNPDAHYIAEPISAPTGVGSIVGVTAGAGLTGGGTTGVVTVGMDATAADFPIIPIEKGGTNANSVADARTNLGLGSAAVEDTGTGDGDIPLLGTNGQLDPERLAAGGATEQILERTANGAQWADRAEINAVDLEVSGLDLRITVGRNGSSPRPDGLGRAAGRHRNDHGSHCRRWLGRGRERRQRNRQRERDRCRLSDDSDEQGRHGR